MKRKRKHDSSWRSIWKHPACLDRCPIISGRNFKRSQLLNGSAFFKSKRQYNHFLCFWPDFDRDTSGRLAVKMLACI
uniref:Uncharacterized protein n=1 Tax=Arundo donax TaxID=35708 RepID=A0A0A9A9Z4_ARUDO